MSNPPRPKPTDPDQHAPGISRTLEENAFARREGRGAGGGGSPERRGEGRDGESSQVSDENTDSCSGGKSVPEAP